MGIFLEHERLEELSTVQDDIPNNVEAHADRLREQDNESTEQESAKGVVVVFHACIIPQPQGIASLFSVFFVSVTCCSYWT